MPENEEAKKQNITIQDFYKRAHERGEQLTFTLDFNKTQSHFYLNNRMEADSNKDAEVTKIVTIMLGKTDYYYDCIKKLGLYYAPLDGRLMGETYDKIDWVLINESKKIDNYVCYKAEYNMVYEREGKELKTVVTAWYCPTIPFSYGPKGYNQGPPGLILELVEFNRVFYATKISMNNKYLKIKMPEGKFITSEEYMRKASKN